MNATEYDPAQDSREGYEVGIAEIRRRKIAAGEIVPWVRKEVIGRATVYQGDMLEVLPGLLAQGVQVDSVVCDPPYHLQSIVKRFAKTGRTESTRTTSGPHQRTANGFMGKQWDGGDIAFRRETWELVYEIMKPGAYIVAFSGSRTYHRMAVALDDAGFIVHPMKGWIFGQGFPKAHNPKIEGMEGWRYGTQSCKPALEPIFFGQKPPDRKMRDNILHWGAGAINIDGCRIGDSKSVPASVSRKSPANCYGKFAEYGETQGVGGHDPNLGRWPANVIHDGSDEVLAAFPQAPGQQRDTGPQFDRKASVYGEFAGVSPHAARGDAGSAARFFYSAKATAADRLGSKHPTVKPVDLMRWLVRLVTPPGGTVLDPFAGSGTTGMACMAEGFDAILIEREAEYVADIMRRLTHVRGADDGLFAEEPPAAPAAVADLFAESTP